MKYIDVYITEGYWHNYYRDEPILYHWSVSAASVTTDRYLTMKVLLNEWRILEFDGQLELIEKFVRHSTEEDWTHIERMENAIAKHPKAS